MNVVSINCLLFVLSIRLISPIYAYAEEGASGGGGGGVLSRLIVYSKEITLQRIEKVPTDNLFENNPGLKNRYLAILRKIKSDLESIEYDEVPSHQEVKDSKLGYKTWIRIYREKGKTVLKIQYNPDPAYYRNLVQNLSVPSLKHTFFSVPQLNDVLGFFLHEIGHHYGMGEIEAWEFAFELVKAFNKIGNLDAPTKYCHYHFGDRRDGDIRVKASEDFILDGMPAQKHINLNFPGVYDQSEQKVPDSEIGSIWVSHDIRNGDAKLTLTISPRYGEDTYLNLDARSELDIIRVFTNPRKVFLVLWCNKTPTPGVKYTREPNGSDID